MGFGDLRQKILLDSLDHLKLVALSIFVKFLGFFRDLSLVKSAGIGEELDSFLYKLLFVDYFVSVVVYGVKSAVIPMLAEEESPKSKLNSVVLFLGLLLGLFFLLFLLVLNLLNSYFFFLSYDLTLLTIFLMSLVIPMKVYSVLVECHADLAGDYYFSLFSSTTVTVSLVIWSILNLSISILFFFYIFGFLGEVLLFGKFKKLSFTFELNGMIFIFKKLWKYLLFRISSSAISGLSNFLEGFVLSYLSPGSLSIFSLAKKFPAFLTGVYSPIMQSVGYSKLVAENSLGKRLELLRNYLRKLWTYFLILIPFLLSVYLFIHWFYSNANLGSFTHTNFFLFIFVLSLRFPFQVLNTLLSRFYILLLSKRVLIFSSLIYLIPILIFFLIGVSSVLLFCLSVLLAVILNYYYKVYSLKFILHEIN